MSTTKHTPAQSVAGDGPINAYHFVNALGSQVNKETLLMFGAALGFDADKLRAARFTTPELVQLLLARARKLRNFYKSEFLPDNLERP